MKEKGLLGTIRPPLENRMKKPRRCGVTMVFDRGMGPRQTADLLEMGAAYIDFIKIGFGTSLLYDPAYLEKKVKTIRDAGVHVYPGGTLLEVAISQGRMEEYLDIVASLGYDYVEVSDGTINLSRDCRRRAIHRAAALGMGVITEVGKKDPNDQISPGEMQYLILSDLEEGAERVIVEGRESGASVGIFDHEGGVMSQKLECLIEGLPSTDTLIWEAPRKNQQVEFIFRFGPNVNLGNIAPDEVLALEALRNGLRGDTLQQVLPPGLYF